MSFWIDGDRVGVRHVELANQGKVASCFPQYGNGPRFSGDVQAFQARVEGENVRIIAHLMNRKKLQGPEIEDRQGMVLFPGNESQSIGLIERDTVRVLNSRSLYRPMIFIAAGSIETSWLIS